MRRSPLLPALAFALALSACVPPKALPLYSKPQFQLSEVHGARVAVLPVAEAALDEDTAGTVAKAYGSKARFLEALSTQVSGAVVKACRQPSLQAGEVRSLLAASPETATLLDPGAVRDGAGQGAPTAAAALAGLGRHEGLEGVRYAVVLRRVGLVRKGGYGPGVPSFPSSLPPDSPTPPGSVTVVGATVSPGGVVSGGTVMGAGGATGGMVVGGSTMGGMRTASGEVVGATVVGGTLIGASTPVAHPATVPTGPAYQVWTHAVLEWAVVDLESGEVVWVDRTATSTTSMYMKVTALHEVEAQLATELAKTLDPPPPRTVEPPDP